jgi:hypothetical protein
MYSEESRQSCMFPRKLLPNTCILHTWALDLRELISLRCCKLVSVCLLVNQILVCSDLTPFLCVSMCSWRKRRGWRCLRRLYVCIHTSCNHRGDKEWAGVYHFVLLPQPHTCNSGHVLDCAKVLSLFSLSFSDSKATIRGLPLEFILSSSPFISFN